MVEPTETPADQSGLATRDHITSGSHETSPTGRPVHTIDATLPAIMESSSVDSQSEFSRRMDAHVRPSDQTAVTRTDEGVHPTTEASKESRPRIQVAPKTPSPRPGESAGAWWNNRRNQIVATAAAFGGLLLLAVVTLFFQTKDGTLVVEIDDPEGLIQVSVIGEDILITEKQKEGEPIKLRPGDHQLHVTRGELEFDSDNFTLKRGEKVVLNVKLAAGQLQVVRNEKEIGHRDMPVPTSADPDRRAAEYVLSIGDTITIKEGGQERSIGAGGDLPQGTFELLKVLMQNRPKVNDVGLGNFKGCKHLTQLVLRLPQVTDAELVYFKDCKNLTMLSLQDTQVTDAGLANFKDCKNLRQLSLSGTKVSDAGLAHLKDWNNLNSLSLYDAIKLSDAGVECLVGMKELSTLYLPPSITDGGMVHVAKLKGLRRLFLPLTITDEGLESVAQLDELELLSLPGCKVTDAGVKKLAALENLTNLNLAGTLVSDEGIAALKDLRNLKGMDLSYTNVTDRSLEQLSTQTMLTDLHLKGTRVSDAGLEYLTSLLKLSLLDVTSTKVTPAGFAKLQEVFPSCKITHSNFDRIVADAVFSLGGSVTVTSSDTSGRVSDAQHLPDTGVWETTGIHLDNTTADESQMLATMPAYGMLLAELREISLTGSKVGLEFQKYVAKHKSLERIDLSDTPCGVPINLQSLPRLAELRLVNTASVVGSQLAQLQSFPSLESLALGGPKVTDTALEYVQPITRLKRLSLVDAPVCGPGLVYVGRMTNLEQLDLSCPALTDEGLRHLKSLSNLTRISITGTKVTAMGVAELKLALPNCQIESDFTDEQIAVAMEKLKQEQK
jgi:Leucine-rich repeat (LRR) protein